MHVGAGLRLSGACDRADDGGVDRLLRSMPGWEGIGNDFDAPVTRDRHVDVHVRQADVASDAGSGFLANARKRPF